MEDYIVSGSTKSGIAYTVDTRVRKDSRFLHLLVKMQDKKTPRSNSPSESLEPVNDEVACFSVKTTYLSG